MTDKSKYLPHRLVIKKILVLDTLHAMMKCYSKRKLHRTTVRTLHSCSISKFYYGLTPHQSQHRTFAAQSFWLPCASLTCLEIQPAILDIKIYCPNFVFSTSPIQLALFNQYDLFLSTNFTTVTGILDMLIKLLYIYTLGAYVQHEWKMSST